MYLIILWLWGQEIGHNQFIIKEWIDSVPAAGLLKGLGSDETHVT